MKIPNYFFDIDDSGWFRPTAHTRGPWDPQACHAGPPTAMMVRQLEQCIPNQRLARVTVDLLRPVPFAGFRVEAEVIKQGRSVSNTRATMIGPDDKVCAHAAGLHITERHEPDMPTTPFTFGHPDAAEAGGFPLSRPKHGLPAFNGDGVEVRYPKGQNNAPGPTTLWMRTVPLLQDEAPSGFQRICPLADCGNAFSRNADPKDYSFVNADLTIVLHRDPEGEWLGSKSIGHWEANGIGLADAVIFDQHGAVGHALQTLVLRKNA